MTPIEKLQMHIEILKAITTLTEHYPSILPDDTFDHITRTLCLMEDILDTIDKDEEIPF